MREKLNIMFPPLLLVYLGLLFAALGLPSTALPAAGFPSSFVSASSARRSVNVESNGFSPSNTGTLFDVAVNGNVATAQTCGFWFDTYIEDVEWCAVYLLSLGMKSCVVPHYGGSSLFCSRNDAYIHGIGVNPNANGAIASSCSDVASAVYWLINNCAHSGWSNDGLPTWMVSGSAPANGNGGLLVVVKAPDGPGVPNNAKARSRRQLRGGHTPILTATEAKEATSSNNDRILLSATNNHSSNSIEKSTVSSTVDIFSVKTARNAVTDPTCGGYNPAPIADVQWCSQYLHSIGSEKCVVPGYHKSAQFCGHGSAVIHGYGLNPDEPNQTESSCEDVAQAIDYLVDHCSDWVILNGETKYFTAGTAPARGNGGLAVIVKTPFGTGIAERSLHLPSSEVVPSSNVTDVVEIIQRDTATDPSCGNWDSTPVADVKWCSAFLHNKGSTPCEVPGYQTNSLFCSRHDAFIYGVGVNPAEPFRTASSCEDVAQAVDYILVHCTTEDAGLDGNFHYYVVGQAPARGNGGLLVVVKDRNGPGISSDKKI